MSKFYSVKRGRVPGIYRNWNDCKEQTSGFSGAVFKSFTTEAEALTFLHGDQQPEKSEKQKEENSVAGDNQEERKREEGITLPMVPAGMKAQDCDHSVLDPSFTNPAHRNLVILYTDGSKRPTINHRGSSCYCRFNQKDFGMSLPISKEITAKYQINDEDYDKLSSPTLEYIAFVESLYHFIQFKFREETIIQTNEKGEQIAVKTVIVINPRLILLFVSDYIGVKCWTDSSWNPEKDYIIKLRDTAWIIINFLRQRGIDVAIHHCPGHKGILGNELADVLAKSPQPFNTLPILVQEISLKFI
jgi:ribonuclease HI